MERVIVNPHRLIKFTGNKSIRSMQLQIYFYEHGEYTLILTGSGKVPDTNIREYGTVRKSPHNPGE